VSGVAVEADVRAAVEDFIDAMNAGDRERLRSRLARSPDAVHVGTALEEWWTSDQVAETIGGGGPESGVTVVVDEIDAHALADDVAWVVGKGRFRSGDGRERPVRMSGVVVREDGRWRFVHSHASIAVPNEELFG
jgi:ketosteroid isomerase-like protein